MWALCTLLVIVEARAHAHSGRSLRVWWLLNVVAACYHLYFDLEEWGQDGWGVPRTELALQLAGFLPSLLLGLAASFEPDSPNERAYARDHEAPPRTLALALAPAPALTIARTLTPTLAPTLTLTPTLPLTLALPLTLPTPTPNPAPDQA